MAPLQTVKGVSTLSFVQIHSNMTDHDGNQQPAERFSLANDINLSKYLQDKNNLTKFFGIIVQRAFLFHAEFCVS